MQAYAIGNLPFVTVCVLHMTDQILSNDIR
jgi:hypothetical protein